MTTELKEKIDSVWLENDFGKWCRAVADDDKQKAEILQEKIFNAGYFSMECLENELASEIVKLIHSDAEVDEYLQLLEKENSLLVGVIIRCELFYKVSVLIKNTVI